MHKTLQLLRQKINPSRKVVMNSTYTQDISTMFGPEVPLRDKIVVAVALASEHRGTTYEFYHGDMRVIADGTRSVNELQALCELHPGDGILRTIGP